MQPVDLLGGVVVVVDEHVAEDEAVVVDGLLEAAHGGAVFDVYENRLERYVI